MTLKREKTFTKDMSKLQISDKHYEKFVLFLGTLLSDEELPPEAKDHELKGEYKGFREFHVSGDLLVIYKIKAGSLYLSRIGSHAQLFK